MKEIDLNISTKCIEALDKLNENVNQEGFGINDLDNLVAKYPECEKQLRDTYNLWRNMDQFDVPPVSERARTRFYNMLGEFEQGQADAEIHSRHRTFTILKWAAVFVMGICVGLIVSNYGGSNSEPDTVSASIQIMADLNTEKSPTERLTALQTIKKNPTPEEYVYEALYATILNDPNVNVRLSAIEAMLHFSDKPKVRALLIQALTRQESPIVQLSLAEVIIKLQEKESIEEIRQLLKSDQLDWGVKMHLKKTLSEI